jgi:arylsulfatase
MNVLWIMTDQHRADCLGFMGHPVVQTPNLDRLAESSVVFDNAFCQSPVCMASRAVLFTGRYPSAVRVRGMGILPPTETTFPEVLQCNGYQTAAFGKVHLTPELYTLNQLKRDVPSLDLQDFAPESMIAPILNDPCKANYGFQTHVGCEDILRGRHREWLKERAPELADAKRPSPMMADGPKDLFVSPYPSEHHAATFVAESAEEFIRSQDGAKPWFTFCSFIGPHHPFEAPADQIARYDLNSIPLPELKGGVDPTCIPEPVASAIGGMSGYSDEVKRRIVLHYLARISLIDDGIGRLLDTLERTGQMEDTLILFTSDHGEFLGNHDLLRKPSMHYDEVMRVPLLVRMPGNAVAPRRETGLVELADVYPTLLGLLGISQTPGVQGMDWSSPLRKDEAIGREDVYSDMFDMEPMRFGERTGPFMAIQTIRTDAWKLSIYPTAGPEYGQLFDLANDPDETRNLYGDAKHAAIREKMLWRLLSRSHRNTDPLPPFLTQY